jgi:isopentenyl diphosphate isomerase/L-lactate dehydrogenase-like FMN-dependent dehydrogenase
MVEVTIPADNSANFDPASVVTIQDFEPLARVRLPKATMDYISTGSANEETLRDNVAAFSRLKILPPVLHGVVAADPSTTVLGRPVKLPILLAPVAVQSLYHPHGALAACRAAAEVGTVYAASSSAGQSVEEIAAASPAHRWYQLYMPRDRGVARRLVERVEQAGYQALIVTVDLGEWKDADRRNRFLLPRAMLLKRLRDLGFEQVHDGMSHAELVEFNLRNWEPQLSWNVFDWLRSITRLPLIIKGVLRPEDARRALDEGVRGIIVSNHGGRQLDGMPATISMLPGVVEAVAGRAEVYLDGGIRRGTDVFKALALGARAVMIGRPYAWALAAGGQPAVRRVLELLHDELCNVMVATGCANVQAISPQWIVRT